MNLRINKQYKCLPFIAIFSMALFICHMLFQNKFIFISIALLSVGSPFMPIIEIINDIVTEVYGLTISLRFFWAGSFMYIIFNSLCYFYINLPSSDFLESQKFYQFLLGNGLFVILFGTLFYVVAFRINAYLLIKWKIVLKGKYFWLRSLASSLIGDTLFLISMNQTWLWFNHVTSEKDAIQLTISSLAIRFVLYVILAFPSTVIVNFLKIIEQVDAYDYGIKFNPFKKEKSTEVSK